MSIHNFKPDEAYDFARFMGIKTKRRGDQLELMSCPYCKSTDKYTFGINLSTGQWECKRASCSMRGNMITLSRDFNFSLGKEVDAYYGTVDYATKKYHTFRDAHKKIEVRERAIEYMNSRGILPEVVYRYEITSLPNKENVLVFPFKTVDGELTFVKYRNMDYKKGESNGSKEWCEADCKPILFGMNQCKDHKTLVITEGQIDSLSCAQAGIDNAVSVPTGKNGFTWVPYCWDFVNSFEQIVVFGDCENGIITLADEIAKRWPIKTKVVRAEDYKGCKDANDLLNEYGPEALKEATANAQPIFANCIKPLSQVKKVNIEEIPYIATNMEKIDEFLSGGFHMGQLAVLTGKRGEGKSTIASMWGAEALNQDYKCFFYSGELMDFYFKDWLDAQITKKKRLTTSEVDTLNMWYGDKAFIYDNAMVNDEDADLLRAIDIAIVQNGCKFIMIDNLMTAMDDNANEDFYRAQSRFVGELAAKAKKYEVFILLIAHPRKTNGVVQNDDISGSSNITDRADLVINFARYDSGNEEEHFCDVSILKNRLTGKITQQNKPIRLVYDPNSRRIADNTNKFFSNTFNWNSMDPYGFELIQGEFADIIPLGDKI